jgi:outer membrane lipoprotein LolB
MVFSSLRRRLLVAACLLPAACATPVQRSPVQRAVSPWPLRWQITGFTLQGRIAVRREQNRFSGELSWRHSPSDDNILISGPLGQGLAELTRDAAGAHLTTAERRKFSAPDLDQLATQVFGFALPLSGMAQWIVGNADTTQRDAAGRPQRAVVDGWNIDYLDWEAASADALPLLIEMRRDELEVRLKIIEWQDLQ